MTGAVTDNCSGLPFTVTDKWLRCSACVFGNIIIYSDICFSDSMRISVDVRTIEVDASIVRVTSRLIIFPTHICNQTHNKMNDVYIVMFYEMNQMKSVTFTRDGQVENLV
jgi:hypothetical protein